MPNPQDPAPVVVVITGSTRGLGFGLAEAFLARGCAVVVSGRHEASTSAAAAKLSARHGDRVIGVAADVTDPKAVQNLWDRAARRFGAVDVWINNAGLNHAPLALWKLGDEQVGEVVATNLAGSVNGALVALRGMVPRRRGQIFNVEGFGSSGLKREGMAVYGSTKRAIRYFTQSLAKDARGTGVLVGAINPGMVVTELLVKGYSAAPEKWESAKKFFNIAADHVETVAPWIADRVLANDRRLANITWLSTGKLMGRFLAAPFRKKRDLFG
jgi:NAD(P)-dependent dehydrogenase (short-subunit alcohol dehydrogenase family)